MSLTVFDCPCWLPVKAGGALWGKLYENEGAAGRGG